MIRLILTNLKYLTFERLFLAGAAASLYFGIRGGFQSCVYGYSDEYPVFAVLIIAAVTLMNTGRENTDGTLRNRLTLGYSRHAIFGSFLVSSLICAVILYLLFSVPFFLISKDVIGKYMSGDRLLLFWFILLCIALLVTVGTVCLTLCIPMLPVAAVALLAAGVGFVALSGLLDRALSEDKYTYYQVCSESPDDFENTDKYPVRYDEYAGLYFQDSEQLNDRYIGGVRRDIYNTAFLLDPYGQLENINGVMRWYFDTDVMKQFEELKKEKPELFEDEAFLQNSGYERVMMLPTYPIYSLGFAAVLAAAGIAVFRKRNIT